MEPTQSNTSRRSRYLATTEHQNAPYIRDDGLDKSSRDDFGQNSNPHILPVNSIQKLPVETLSAIFEFCIEDDSGHIPRLQIVSKRWYFIVINTPTLWVNISVVGPFDRKQIKSQKKYIDTCTKNSKTLPIRMVFDAFRNRGLSSIEPEQETMAAELLDYLSVSSIERWISFDLRWIPFTLGQNSAQKLPYEYIFNRATQLRSLVIHDNTGTPGSEAFPRNLSNAFSSGSSLRVLELFGIEFALYQGLSPLFSVQELTIGMTEDWRWDFLYRGNNTKPWIYLFPGLQKLRVEARDKLFLPYGFRHTPFSPFNSDYEAKHLREIYFHGPAPPWVLRRVSLPLVNSLTIETNWRTAHAFHEESGWDEVDVRMIQEISLICSKSFDFWSMNTDVTKIQSTFRPFSNVATVHAMGCIWSKIALEFDCMDEEILRPGLECCIKPHSVSGATLRTVFERANGMCDQAL